jgi:hypothetical protein
MKKLACILCLLIVSLSQASALDSASISCSGRRGYPDRFSYNLEISSRTDEIRITKFVGSRGGGIAVRSWSGVAVYGPIQRGVINIYEDDLAIFLQIFLDHQESWGYKGRGTLLIDNIEIPMSCTVRFN